MRQKNSSGGNILFIILACVALFAALSFVMTRNSTGFDSATTQEQNRLYATEIIEYGNSLRPPVDRMLLVGGISDTNTAGNGILFSAVGADAAYGAPGAQASTELFNAAGGKAAYLQPPAAACAAACAYEFSGQYTITGVADNAKSELVMLVAGVTQDVCVRINSTLALGWGGTIPTGDVLTLTRFDGVNYGNLGGANPITLTGGANEFVGRRSFCYRESGGGQRYIFLYVLRAR